MRMQAGKQAVIVGYETTPLILKFTDKEFLALPDEHRG